MAYDIELAERIRSAMPDDVVVTERRMFGGLAFVVEGTMVLAARGHGGLLVRADPETVDALVSGADGVRPMVMRGREMRGWLHVVPEAARTRRQVRRWVDLGIARARALPPEG